MSLERGNFWSQRSSTQTVIAKGSGNGTVPEHAYVLREREVGKQELLKGDNKKAIRENAGKKCAVEVSKFARGGVARNKSTSLRNPHYMENKDLG